jgi:hypothetical protein
MADDFLDEFSQTWPRAGTMRNGSAYRLPKWERPTSEIASGLWPTSKASDAERGGRGDLIAAVRGKPNSHFRLPTPSASDAHGHQRSATKQGGDALRERIGGQLNPAWVTLLMGFPPGWLDGKTERHEQPEVLPDALTSCAA